MGVLFTLYCQPAIEETKYNQFYRPVGVGYLACEREGTCPIPYCHVPLSFIRADTPTDRPSSFAPTYNGSALLPYLETWRHHHSYGIPTDNQPNLQRLAATPYRAIIPQSGDTVQRHKRDHHEPSNSHSKRSTRNIHPKPLNLQLVRHPRRSGSLRRIWNERQQLRTHTANSDFRWRILSEFNSHGYNVDCRRSGSWFAIQR
jgi:hypothetical protein